MAKAEKRELPRDDRDYEIDITLTADEADAVLALVGSCHTPGKRANRAATGIWRALDNLCACRAFTVHAEDNYSLRENK